MSGLLARLLPGTSSRELRVFGKTLLHAMLVGVAAGLVGALFFAGLELLERVVLENLAGYEPLRAAGETFLPPAAPRPFRPWILMFLPAVGGLAAGLISLLAPEVRGGGADASIDAFHQHGGQLRRRVIWAKTLASIFTLGLGGSGGREGPTMQIGASLGSFIGRWLRVTARERRILMVAGIAAGIAAVFRTPLGAALFAVEVLYRDDFETDALVPAVLASVIAYSVVISVFGESTLLAHAARYPFVPAHLPLYALLAFLIAPLSVGFVGALRAAQNVSARLPLPEWARPAVGGLVLGLAAAPILIYFGQRVGHPGQGLGLFGGGYGAAQMAITGAAWLHGGWGDVQLLLVLCGAKLFASSLTIGTGGSAGDFAPSLAIGALFGGAFGRAAQLLLADPRIDPGAFALVGMATFYGGIAHVPLAATILVCELAGSYDLLVPLMLGVGITFLVIRRRTLYPAQLPSRADSPAHAGELVVSILETMRVGDLVDRSPERTAAAETPLSELVARMPSGTRPTFAVVENGLLSGVVSTGDVVQAVELVGPLMPVIAVDLMNAAPQVVHPEDDLYATLALFRQHDADALPVVDRETRAYIGMLSRAAILEALRARAAERGAQVLREHGSIAALAQGDQLAGLLSELPAYRRGTVQRIAVPAETVGRSLREADFRNRFAYEVIAVQKASGELQTPPDPGRPLSGDDVLIVLQKKKD